jgi:hypothetical protein
MTTPLSRSPHVAPESIAAFLDGRLHGAERALVAEHLCECADCRRELIDTRRAIRALAMRRAIVVAAGPAMAAGLAFLLLVARADHRPRPPADGLREPAVTVAEPPLARSPVDTVGQVSAFVWSSVPNADRYRLTLFDRHGTVLWEAQLQDTTITLPPSVHLVPSTYVWRVEARAGWDRWVASPLTAFVLSAPESRDR